MLLPSSILNIKRKFNVESLDIYVYIFDGHQINVDVIFLALCPMLTIMWSNIELNWNIEIVDLKIWLFPKSTKHDHHYIHL